MDRTILLLSVTGAATGMATRAVEPTQFGFTSMIIIFGQGFGLLGICMRANYHRLL